MFRSVERLLLHLQTLEAMGYVRRDSLDLHQTVKDWLPQACPSLSIAVNLVAHPSTFTFELTLKPKPGPN